MQQWSEEMYSHLKGWSTSSSGRLRCALPLRWEELDFFFFFFNIHNVQPQHFWRYTCYHSFNITMTHEALCFYEKSGTADIPLKPNACPVNVLFSVHLSRFLFQGCMNNISFGSEKVGYYETVAGGAGAGPSWNGRSGVHSHMTNTRITDPEILEKRWDMI